MNAYELDILFETHLFEETINASILEEKTNEALLFLSEGTTYHNLNIIQEGFKEKMKATFEKLLTMIKNLWAKFVRNVDSLLKSDKDYLTKYKNIIFKNSLKDDTYIMYPYMNGENELKNSKIPAFNLTSIQGKTEEDIIKMIDSKYNSKDKKFTDIARYTFRGKSDKEIEISAGKISLTDMYNFCINYGKLYTTIERDMKEVQKASNEAILQINKMPNKVNNESAIYSFFKEEMLYEAEDNKDEKKNDTGGPTPQKKSEIDDNSNVKGGEHDTKDIPDKVKDKENDLEIIKTYLRVCYGFLGVKMSVSEEMYKAYMYILRDHVKQHVGTKGKKEEPNLNEPAKKKEKEGEDSKGEGKEKESEGKDSESDNSTPKKGLGSKLVDFVDKVKSKDKPKDDDKK